MTPEVVEESGAIRHEDHFLILVMDARGENGEPCRLMDISIGGLSVEMPRQLILEIDSTILVEIPMGRSLSRIRTRCQIRGVGDDEDQKVRMQFLDDSELFRKSIEESIKLWDSRLIEEKF